MLKWSNRIIKLTFIILILSTPSLAAHFISRTPITIGSFLAYVFNLLILLMALIAKEIFVHGLPLFCDKIIRGVIILVVIIVPLFFWLPLYSTFDLSKLTLLYTLSLIMLGLWLIKAIASQQVHLCRTSLDIPILAFLAINIVCTLTSVSQCISLFGFYKRYEGLLAITNYIFLFYVIVNFMNTPKLVFRLIKTMMMVAVVISIYGIFQHFGYDPFKWSFSAKERVFGTFGNPVFLSAYLIMMIPLGLTLFFQRERFSHPLVQKIKKIPAKSKKIKKRKETLSQGLLLSWIKIFDTVKEVSLSFFHFLQPWWYRISLILLFICFCYTNTRATTLGLAAGLFIFYLLICGLVFSFIFYSTITVGSMLGFMVILKYFSATHLVTLLLGGFFITLFWFGPLIFKALFSQEWLIKNKRETTIVALVLMGFIIYFNINPEISVVSRIINTIIKTEPTKLQVTPVEKKKETTDIETRIQQVLPTPEIKFTGGAQEERMGLWRSTIGIILKNTKNLLLGIGLDTLQLMNIGTDKAHNDILDMTVTRGVIGLLVYLGLLFTYIWVSFKAASREANPRKKLLIAACLTSVIGYLIQNQFSFGEIVILSHFWMIMGITMVMIKADQKPKTDTQRLPRIKNLTIRIVLYGLIMGLIIVLIYLAFRPYIADMHYRRGFDFVEKRRYAEGIPGLEKSVEIFPYENCYWKVLNSIYVERANNDPANRKIWVEKAIKGSNFLLTLIPKDTGSYFNLGMAYYLNGETTQAISFYQKVLEIEPEHTDTLNNLATIYANQGKYNEAEELFKKVIKINPNHTSAKNNLIQLYKIQNKNKEASALDTNYAKQVHLSLAKNYYEKGDINKAIEEIKQVIAIDPNDIQSLCNLGSFYLLKKKHNEAKIEFNKVLKLDPNNDYARRMINTL